MRKQLALLLALFWIGTSSLGWIASAAAEGTSGEPAPPVETPTAPADDREPNVYANGQRIDSPYAAKLRTDGTVYVSVRMVSEALGMKVSWNGTKRLAVVTTTNDQVFSFPLYRSYFWLNGQRYDLKESTETVQDGAGPGFYVMVPAAAIGELFGADVKWDAQTRQLNVEKQDGSVPADRKAAFRREWDAWQPEPTDTLQLAKALFANAKLVGGKLTVFVPSGWGDKAGFLHYQGAKETNLTPGKTYTYATGAKNAGVYAYRNGADGAIDEEYWIWLDPGSPNLAAGIYANQGLSVLIQDIRGQVVSLERMKQVLAEHDAAAGK